MIIKTLSIFVAGAVPWLEVLIAIPLGIGIGLPPLISFFAGISGNIATIILLYLFMHQIKSKWWDKKRDNQRKLTSKRKERFMIIWNKWGLPGVCITSPIVTGTHLALFLLMLMGSNEMKSLYLIILSVLIWGAGITIALYFFFPI